MKSPDEFLSYYERELLPVLQGLEARRKKILSAILTTACMVMAVISALFFFVSALRQTPPVLILLFAGGVAICVLVGWLMSKDFIREFKRHIISGIVRFVDDSLTYSSHRYISESQFRGSRIFEHRIDRYRGEDHVSGAIGVTKIEFSEVHAEDKTTSHSSKGGTKTQWHTVFKGLFCIADFNKHFRGVTVVLPDVAERLFGFLGKKLQALNFIRGGELIKLEDPEFEQEFVVYGDDQIEARYILSMSLMRRILEFKRKTGKQVYISFAANNVHVAISCNQNLFEPRIFRTLLNFGMCRKFLDDIQLAVGIVEDLNLNTRIWTKE